MDLHGVVVDQFQSHFFPAACKVVHGVLDLDYILGKVAGPQVGKLGIQDHLPGVVHIISVQVIAVLPHNPVPDLDLPYLALVVHLDRILFRQLAA